MSAQLMVPTSNDSRLRATGLQSHTKWKAKPHKAPKARILHPEVGSFNQKL